MFGEVEGVVECVLIIPDVKAIIIVIIVLHISVVPSVTVGSLRQDKNECNNSKCHGYACLYLKRSRSQNYLIFSSVWK